MDAAAKTTTSTGSPAGSSEAGASEAGAEAAGLGLAVCQRIVALHGGRMEFESTPGRGTRASVWLKGAEDA